MTTQPPAPGAPEPSPQDDALRRALEIHQRLTREHNWDFLGIRSDPPAPPAPPAAKPDGGERKDG